jgi:hypothetical protein
MSKQEGPEDAVRDQDRQRRSDANPVADADDHVQLRDRDDDEEHDQKRHGNRLATRPNRAFLRRPPFGEGTVANL